MLFPILWTLVFCFAVPDLTNDFLSVLRGNQSSNSAILNLQREPLEHCALKWLLAAL
jgi:hypothetical protein